MNHIKDIIAKDEYLRMFCQPSDVSTHEIKRQAVRMAKARGYRTGKFWNMPRKQIAAVWRNLEDKGVVHN